MILFLMNGCVTKTGQASAFTLPEEIHTFLFPPVEVKSLQEMAYSDIQYYAKAKDLRVLRKLHSTREIHTFLDTFWTHLDPTPGTLINEFKNEHYQRLEYVKTYYPDSRGWGQSDRGRVYILYGPPVEIINVPWLDGDYKTVEVWLYNKTAGDNFAPPAFYLYNPGQMQFVFAEKQYLGKYTQIYSTEAGELCDPRLFKSSNERSGIIDGL